MEKNKIIYFTLLLPGESVSKFSLLALSLIHDLIDVTLKRFISRNEFRRHEILNSLDVLRLITRCEDLTL